MLFKLYSNFFFSKEDVNKILEEFCNYRIKEFKNYKKKYDTDFLKKVVVGVHQNEKKITKMIECNLSENWLIDRVDLTMKAIISLAIYELINYESIPLPIIINEYLEFDIVKESSVSRFQHSDPSSIL